MFVQKNNSTTISIALVNNSLNLNFKTLQLVKSTPVISNFNHRCIVHQNEVYGNAFLQLAYRLIIDRNKLEIHEK